jgi:two-component system chemotaxis response regulator CheY
MVSLVGAARTIAERVLIADPDESVRTSFRAAFCGDVRDVVEAVDGRDAMAKAFTRRPSAVITELRLPFVDGLALCEVLRSDSFTRDVPLIVVTCESQPGALSRARRVADAVFVKPAPFNDVVAEVLRCVAGRVGESRLLRSRAGEVMASARKRVQAHRRYFTSTPPVPPPAMKCPGCDRPLTYEHSYVGGVNAAWAEQWDYYTCTAESLRYQYRHRTRKLRRTA